jgi:hypothetical protein
MVSLVSGGKRPVADRRVGQTQSDQSNRPDAPGRLSFVKDPSVADWTAPRLGPFGGQVGSVVPRGSPVYGRVLHPVRDHDGEPATLWTGAQKDRANGARADAVAVHQQSGSRGRHRPFPRQEVCPRTARSHWLHKVREVGVSLFRMTFTAEEMQRPELATGAQMVDLRSRRTANLTRAPLHARSPQRDGGGDGTRPATR